MQANPGLISDLGAATVADALVAIAFRGGARHFFGMPGDSLNPLLEAIRKHPDVRLITVRHEGYGAIMASAYAKLGGTLGVCLGASGPGATHLALGVVDALADAAPLLAVTGQVPRAMIGTGAFQEIDAAQLFAGISVSSRTVTSNPVPAIRQACDNAVYHRGPAHLSIPGDVMRSPANARDIALTIRSTLPVGRPQLSTARLEQAIDLLASTARRLIVVGEVDPGNHEIIAALSQALGAPIVVLPEGIGAGLREAGGAVSPLLSDPQSAGRRLCADAQCIVSFGAVRRKLSDAVSRDTALIEICRPSASSGDGARLRLEGEVKSVATLLLQRVLRDLTKGDVSTEPERTVRPDLTPILWRAVNAAWPKDGILCLESGAIVEGALQFLEVRQRRITSSFNASIGGYAIPASIGAVCASPATAVLAVTNIDDFQESMPELMTLAKYRFPVTIVCLVPANDLPFDPKAYASACGLQTTSASSEEALSIALARAAQADAPQLIVTPSIFAPDSVIDASARGAPGAIAGVTNAELLAEGLARLGVKRVYGKSRRIVQPFVDAVGRKTGMRFIDVQHPESSALMASAVAKTRGEPNVCIAATWSDCILQMNGLFDASFDGGPVLLLAPRNAASRCDATSSPDLLRLFDAAACWTGALATSQNPGPPLSAAIDEAAARGGVAVLAVDWETIDRPTELTLPSWLRPPSPPSRLLPRRDVLREAAHRLLRSPRVLILAGRGAQGADAELLALSEFLDAPVATTMPGRGSVPDTFPRFVGGIGSSGHRAAEDAYRAAELVLSLGHSARSDLFGAPPERATIHVDHSISQLSAKPPTDLCLHSDIRLTLAALLARMREISAGNERFDQPARARTSFAEHHARAFRTWLSKTRAARSPTGLSIQPSQICHALERVLARTKQRALVTVDVGVTTLWAYRHFVGDHDRVWTSSFGTMGFSVPAAIALAEMTPRNGPVVAIVGDGGLCVTLAELASASRLSTPIVPIVFNNGKLAAVKYEQEVMGWPEFGTRLHNVDFAAYAQACGLRGIRVERHDELEKALTHAICGPGPCLVDVLCDPHELPAPPHVHPVQGAGFAMAMLREAREQLRARRACRARRRPVRLDE